MAKNLFIFWSLSNLDNGFLECLNLFDKSCEDIYNGIPGGEEMAFTTQINTITA